MHNNRHLDERRRTHLYDGGELENMRILFVFLYAALCCGQNPIVSSGAPLLNGTASVSGYARQSAGATYQLLCLGDSLTAVGPPPSGTVTVTHCSGVASSLLSNRSITATPIPFGMVGYSWNYTYSLGPWLSSATNTLNVAALSFICPLVVPGLTNIAIVEGGSNGIFLGLHTASQEYSDFQTGYANIKSCGITDAHIIVTTLLPRQDSSAFDTARGIYNADVKTFCSANGCSVADWGGDANIGCSGCEDNLTYYQADKIHLNNAGQAVAASLEYPLVP